MLNKDKLFNVKDCFVCEFCRNICEGNCSELLDQIAAGNITEENKDLVDRKQKIKCLGRFCDRPCKYQDLTAYENVDLTPFLRLIRYLGAKSNELIWDKNELEREIKRLKENATE